MLQTLSYIINVAPEGVPQVVKLSQNENGRTLAFTLTGAGTLSIPAGATVTISGTKPDGVVYSATGALSGNVASFSETTQMTAVSGIWPAKIKVTYNGETIATCKIVMAIDPDPVAPGSVPSSSQLNGLVAEAQQYATYAKYEAFGSPLVAATAAAMTDKTRVYVYTGSETGKTAGHWYYWNGSAWTDGGVYNSQGINTDTTLTLSGMAADSKATGDQITAIKTDLSELESTIGFVVKTEYDSVSTSDASVFTKLKGINAYPDPPTGIKLASNSTYNTFYRILTEPASVYFDSNISFYCAISYGKNCTNVDSGYIYCSDVDRKRTSDNNLPTAENRLELLTGDVIAITIPVGNNVVVHGLTNHYAISDDMEAEINNVIAPTKNAVDYLMQPIENAVTVNESSLFTKLDSTSANAASDGYISLSSGSGYSIYATYYYVLENDADLYFATATMGFYCAITYGEDYAGIESTKINCSNSARKRASENNLPTSANPVSLKAGDVIAITIAVGNSVNIYGLNPGYALTTNGEKLVSGKKPYIKYNSTVDGYNTERLYIYIPTGVGYIRFNFEHYINNSNNADCWLVHPLYAVDDNFATRFALTVMGEFECAIKISNAPDFMGGSNHGSEVMESLEVYVDGALTAPSDIVDYTPFNALRIIERSTLYDPNDEVTQVAVHGKEYVFSADGLKINQFVNWLANENLSSSYMAMLPVAKTVTNKLIPDDTYQAVDLPSGYFSRTGIEYVIPYSASAGFSVKFGIPRWDISGSIQNKGKFLITDNGGNGYNKCYFFCCDDGSSVSSGDRWITTTLYEFGINK